MSLKNELKSMVQEAASNPKVASTVQVTTATLGAASFADLIQGVLSTMAIISGVIATLLLARVHWMTGRQRDLEYKMLKKKARDMGIDVPKD